MSVKISALPVGVAPTGTELIPAVQSGQTVSLTTAQISTEAFAALIQALGVSPAPATDNTETLGTVSHAFAQLYLGPNHSPALSSSGNIANFVRTAAEIAAGVTPTDYSYQPGDLRRYGADVTGVSPSDAALVSAALANFYVLFPPGVLKFNAKFQPTQQVTFVMPGTYALTINVGVNDYWVQTTTSGKQVSCRGGVQIVGNTGNTLSGGFSLFDNGDRPLENLLMHDFGKEAVRFVQSVNPILRDSRIYNAGATSATDCAVRLDAGSTSTVSPCIENCYISSTHIGIATTGTIRAIQLEKTLFESCGTGIKTAAGADGQMHDCWFEACTVDGDFTDSQIYRDDVFSTNSPDGVWNYTWSGTNANDRFTQRGERMAGGGYKTGSQTPSNTGVWDDVSFISSTYPTFRVGPNPGGAAYALIQTERKGNYRCAYRATFQNGSGATCNVALRLYNVTASAEIAGSYINAQVPIGGCITLSGEAFASLAANAQIKMQVTSQSTTCGIQVSQTGLAAPTASVYAALLLHYLGME